MKKRNYIFSIVLAAAFAVATPSSAMEATSEPEMTSSNMEAKVTLTVTQSVVVVEGAAGQTLEVISLTGRPVMKVRIENQSQRVDLNLPKGCYILKIDNVVRKVSIP